MKKMILLSSILLSGLMSTAQENSPFARTPALSPDGKSIAFSFQGDIWTADINGDNTNRITIHEAYESNPIWSSDGKSIAFSSNRFGNNDIYNVNSEGGIPKRITYHSAGDLLTDWTSSGQLLFQSNRSFKQVEWDREMQSVSSDGGTPQRLLDALGSEAVESPGGQYIAYVHGACRIAREAYTGSANRDIWIYNKQRDSYIQITNFDGQDYHPVWGSDNKLYFLSARNGKYNIFLATLSREGLVNGEIKQITSEKTDGIRFFDVSSDNSILVYEKDVHLYRMSLSGGKTAVINLNIATDYRFDPYEHKTFTSKMENYSVSPNGKYTALIVHGEVFITENNKDKSLTKNVSNSPAREKDAVWLNDSTVVYSSDRDGQYDLYVVSSSDSKQTDLFKTLKRKTTKISSSKLDESAALISPNGEQIAFVRGANYGEGSLITAKISSAGNITSETTLQKGWSTPSGVGWSPDSKWLAFSMSDLSFNSEVYIQAADGKTDAINVSMHPRGDYSPVWSPDGSKLGFTSSRNNSDSDIWYVWLKKEDYQKTKQDWDDEESETSDDKEDSEESIDIIIDRELIHERLVQLTSLSGDEGGLAISKDGKTFYFTSTSPVNKGSDLYKINWDKTDMEAVTKGGRSPRGIELDSKGKYLYLSMKGKLSRIAVSSDKLESLPFKGKMTVDFEDELNQVFEEGWRALRDGFYDPEFHGQNWEQLRTKYKPYCMSASTKTDFFYMYNNMLGQLNASHMGLRGSDREDTQNERTGLLGIDITTENDGILVTRIIPNSPADKVNSKLEIGDVIIAVNGIKTEQSTSFWSLLNNTDGSKLYLTVKNNGKEREVTIRPVTSLRNELYDEWVKERRKLTDKYSNGRLGYLHIRGMNMPSFERFERELTAAGNGKEAIVIDVRYNGGGWTTDYLMTILNVKQHAYTIPRGAAKSLDEKLEYRNYYPFSERLPFFVWNKPSIAICNENSYSNAEIFAHAYKNLGIGTLVGKPTFGAVISTGGLGLMDGSFIRMPFRAWFVKADDKNMERIPAVPNIDVDNSPNAKALGIDEQLKVACDELIKQVDQK